MLQDAEVLYVKNEEKRSMKRAGIDGYFQQLLFEWDYNVYVF